MHSSRPIPLLYLLRVNLLSSLLLAWPADRCGEAGRERRSERLAWAFPCTFCMDSAACGASYLTCAIVLPERSVSRTCCAAHMRRMAALLFYSRWDLEGFTLNPALQPSPMLPTSFFRCRSVFSCGIVAAHLVFTLPAALPAGMHGVRGGRFLLAAAAASLKACWRDILFCCTLRAWHRQVGMPELPYLPFARALT